MRSLDSILGEIATEGADGKPLGSIDRCTLAELIEAKEEFPDQFCAKNQQEQIEEEKTDELE